MRAITSCLRSPITQLPTHAQIGALWVAGEVVETSSPAGKFALLICPNSVQKPLAREGHGLQLRYRFSTVRPICLLRSHHGAESPQDETQKPRSRGLQIRSCEAFFRRHCEDVMEGTAYGSVPTFPETPLPVEETPP